MNRSDHDGNAQVLQPNDADTERNTELKPEISQCINSASKVKPEMTATNAEMQQQRHAASDAKTKMKREMTEKDMKSEMTEVHQVCSPK